MSTTPLQMTGNYEGNKLVIGGESRNPDGKLHEMKFVTKTKDKDKMVFTAYVPGPDGNKAAMMSILYEHAR